MVENDQPTAANTADDIVWTPQEAFACALCWAGYSFIAARDDTPEQCWLSITPQARNDYRRVANNRLLLSVARNKAVAILPPADWSPEQLEMLGGFANLTAEHRILQILMAVWRAAKLRSDCGSGKQP